MSLTLTEVPTKMLFRVGEAAEILEVHENTVRAWCEKGYLKIVNSPTFQRRITRESLERCLSATPQSDS